MLRNLASMSLVILIFQSFVTTFSQSSNAYVTIIMIYTFFEGESKRKLIVSFIPSPWHKGIEVNPIITATTD